MASHPGTADQPDTPRNRGDDDAPHLSPATPAEDQRTILLNEIAWGAVLAGVVVALVTQLLLNMLGLGIGIATLDPGTGDNPSATSLSIGAGIWWTLSGILASLVGGYAAGRLSGRPKEATAAWHGLTAWAFTTLVIFYLLSSTVGGVLGGVYNTVSGALGGLGRTAAATAGAAAPALSQVADPMAAIETSLREASGGNDPAALRDAAVTAMRAALTGDQAQAQEARERAAAGDRPGAEHPDRGGPHPGRGLRAAVPADRGAGAAAGDGGGRHGRPGGLARGAVRLLRPGLGALAAWFGGRAGAVYPTLTDLALPGRGRRP